MAQRKLHRGVHEHGHDAGLRLLWTISCSFNPLDRGWDERGSHFRLEKKINITGCTNRACACRLPGNVDSADVVLQVALNKEASS